MRHHATSALEALHRFYSHGHRHQALLACACGLLTLAYVVLNVIILGRREGQVLLEALSGEASMLALGPALYYGCRAWGAERRGRGGAS